MNMRESLVLAITICFVLPVASLGQPVKKRTTKSSPADQRLSLDQIRKLIAIRTPDDVVAQEIQSRGIAVDYSRKDIEEIRQQGAGPETLAALNRLFPAATLTVKTEPGADVRVDDSRAARAGANGEATIPSLDPGPHRIAVQKQYFMDFSSNIDLKGRDNTVIEAPLSWAVGFISVSTNVPNAQIQAPGVPAQYGRITHLPVPIGQATIAATAPQRKTVSQTVTVEPGKETTLTLSLPPDEAAIKTMVDQVHAAFQARRYPAVLQQAAQYFETGVPKDKEVMAEVAVSYLETNRYEEFKNAASEALGAGGRLRIPVEHHHASVIVTPGTQFLHSAILELSAQNFGYQPEGSCSLPVFQVPWSEVRMGNRQAVTILTKHQSVEVLDLVVPNPSNSKRSSTMNLAMPRGNHSQVQAVREFLATMIR